MGDRNIYNYTHDDKSHKQTRLIIPLTIVAAVFAGLVYLVYTNLSPGAPTTPNLNANGEAASGVGAVDHSTQNDAK